jgi:isoquinoline 1-oxidoreductase beta subunit
MVDGAIKLHKITSVADAGRTLDRVNSVSMIEGGVVWGLSVALYSGLSFDQGRPRETNFDAYRVATVPDVPELITDFLENRKTIGGLGEIGPVCVPAALCNALFAATGKRYRQLPLSRERVFTASCSVEVPSWRNIRSSSTARRPSSTSIPRRRSCGRCAITSA